MNGRKEGLGSVGKFFCRVVFKPQISSSLALFPYCTFIILHYKTVYMPPPSQPNTNSELALAIYFVCNGLLRTGNFFVCICGVLYCALII